jgi:homocitrate synthase
MPATTASPDGTPVSRTPRPFQASENFLSNISNFNFIESTLREGEQFSNAFFDTGKTHYLIHTKHHYRL